MVHQLVNRAYRMAIRRGVVATNVASLVDSPTHRETEMNPLSEADARRILAAATDARNGAGWSVALALGLRQCEALGLRWAHVDLAKGELRVYQLTRTRFRRGCEDPRARIADKHRPSCSPGCTRPAQQASGRSVSRRAAQGADDRRPAPLLPLLRAQKVL